MGGWGRIVGITAFAVLLFAAGMGGAVAIEPRDPGPASIGQEREQQQDKPGSDVLVAPNHQPIEGQRNADSDADVGRESPNAVDSLVADTIRAVASSVDRWLLLFTALGAVWAAAAATCSVRVAQNTAQKELRAYLTPEVATSRDNRGTYALRVTWKNTGNTPALRMVTTLRKKTIVGADLPTGYRYPGVRAEDASDVSTFGSGQDRSGGSIQFPLIDLTLISQGNRSVFVWGAAEYNDVIKSKIRRRTEFCYRVAVREISKGQYSFGYRLYGPHNGMDETCHKQPETDSSGERAHRPGP
jgi:hypothetical protein